MEAAEPLDGRFDVILLPGRDAARSHDQIMVGACGGEGVGECRLAVGTDAEIADSTTKAAEQCGQHDAVRVIDRAGGERGSRVADFVPGRQQCHAQRTKRAYFSVAESGGEAEIRGTQPQPGRERGLAFRNIFPGVTAVGALLDSGPEADALVLEGAILLHHHGIGAIRHRRTGKDPDRLAAPGAAAERMARRRPSGDRKHGLLIR